VRTKRVLIPVYKDEVSPRFDLAAEGVLAMVSDQGVEGTEEFLLPSASAEGMCDLALRKDVDVVICGGIEEEYYHYLRWKRIEVVDNVAAKTLEALKQYCHGHLKSGGILLGKGENHAR